MTPWRNISHAQESNIWHLQVKWHGNCRHAKSLSRVWLFATPWTVAHQAPLSMGVFRQEYWNGLPCPPPEDLPDPMIESASLTSPAKAGRFLTLLATWESQQGYLGFTLKYSGTNKGSRWSRNKARKKNWSLLKQHGTWVATCCTWGSII